MIRKATSDVLAQLPPMYPKDVAYLRKLGAKISTTRPYAPPKGWKVVVKGDSIEQWDARHTLRFTYKKGDSFASLRRRYDVQNYKGVPNFFCMFDRAEQCYVGAMFHTREAAEDAFTRTHKDWREGWAYWQDELPKPWWQRLLSWVRTTRAEPRWIIDSDDTMSN